MAKPEFAEVYEAARVSVRNDWALIEAIAIAADRQGLPIVGAKTVANTMAACYEAGRGIASSTAKNYCVLAKFDFDAAPRDRQVIRRYGTSIIRLFAQAGWTPEAAAEYLKGSPKTYRDVESTVRPTRSRATPTTDDPELWDEDDWEAFDAGVVNAAVLVLRAFNLRQRGLYHPSVEATAQLALLRSSDWDAALAELSEA